MYLYTYTTKFSLSFFLLPSINKTIDKVIKERKQNKINMSTSSSLIINSISSSRMIFFISCVLMLTSSNAFTILNSQQTQNKIILSLSLNDNNNNENSRRSILNKVLTSTVSITAAALLSTSQPANAEAVKKNSAVGREIASFRELIYNFNNTALDGGLDASTIKEPNISFIEFGNKMQAGEVAFVEFMAPSGAVAYVTLKPNRKNPKPKPLRIGQGYPTGGKNSWSSPDYVIRSVVNFKVPYVFTVPALAKVKYPKQNY